MRIVKNAEERKMEILDTAEHLFETQGFDNTSTNDILNEIGIARGTLYYHFKSKEEILDAIISRLTRQLLEKAKKLIEKKNVPLSQQLTLIMLAAAILIIKSWNRFINRKMPLCIKRYRHIYYLN